jgi:diacylglycerol kinase family enzyme
VLSEHADLRQLAEDAVARGADVIGMAGGDGSQAIVASVAAEHGIAYVCVPAGTRNHLALDLGVNRRDVVGSLDAFGAARQAWMDLARVNNHVFVNNASLGVYAEIVSSDAYRDAKIRTVSSMLPDLLGSDATPFDLKIEGPDGRPIDGVHLVLVSNGPYVLDRLGALGTRPRLNAGCLGIAALRLDGPADVAAFIALEAAGRVDNFDGWTAWTAPTVVIGADAPVAAGVDGESRQFDPPLEFAIWPGALRVRTAIHHPGVSPAATRHGVGRSTFSGLARIVLGYPSGLIDEPSGQQGAPGRPATGSSVRKSC